MKEKIVRKLENEITESIAAIVQKAGLKQLPLLPTHRTIHLMAKAAVAVYESALENSPPGQG